ncbi:MAG: RNA polymerase sigma factor [Polyangiaceae bacterium]|nr:RNA polymerase sigma factor [Polyangiaceae bacterium]
MEARDAALVDGLRRRDPAAFDALYARHEPAIFRFLWRLSGRRDVAEDLFQETWLSVARHAERLTDDTDIVAWLFTIARNRYRSYRRWALLDLTRIAELGREPVDDVRSPEHDVDARNSAAAVSRALGRLSATHREVLLLAVVEGLAPRQVAAVLGLTPEAVRQRLHRARAELTSKLEREVGTLRRGIEGGTR